MTMKSDAQRDPAEGSRSTIEADLGMGGGTGTSGMGSGPSGSGPLPGGEQIMNTANDLAREIPGRVEGAVEALTSTATRWRGEDEETLTAAYAAGLGLTVGLLFAGANRLIVLVALGPTAFLGAALFGRLRGAMGGASRSGTPAKAAR